MGDRIAILREGGVLAQYATPAELLMRPADEFVEDFVGSDRALKRLALTRACDVDAATGRRGRAVGSSATSDAPVAWERDVQRTRRPVAATSPARRARRPAAQPSIGGRRRRRRATGDR